MTGIVDQAIRSSFNFITREARAEAASACLERLQRGRPLLVRAHRALRRALHRRGEAAHRPPLPAGAAVEVLGHAFSATRATMCSTASGAVHRRGRRARGARARDRRSASSRRSAGVRLPSAAGRRRTVARARRAAGRCARLPRVDGVPTVCRRRTGGLDRGRRAGPARERAVLRRRRHDRRGFSLDRLGDDDDDQPDRVPDRRQRRDRAERRAAGGALRRRSRPWASSTPATSSCAPAISISPTLRPAAGFGVRYRSPVGPIRVDLGFNLDRRELRPGRLERRTCCTSPWGRHSEHGRCTGRARADPAPCSRAVLGAVLLGLRPRLRLGAAAARPRGRARRGNVDHC